jgi:hypothetical protein
MTRKPEIKTTAPPSFVNELLENRLIREDVRISNSAAQTTKTITYPAGAQQKGPR